MRPGAAASRPRATDVTASTTREDRGLRGEPQDRLHGALAERREHARFAALDEARGRERPADRPPREDRRLDRDREQAPRERRERRPGDRRIEHPRQEPHRRADERPRGGRAGSPSRRLAARRARSGRGKSPLMLRRFFGFRWAKRVESTRISGLPARVNVVVALRPPTDRGRATPLMLDQIDAESPHLARTRACALCSRRASQPAP